MNILEFVDWEHERLMKFYNAKEKSDLRFPMTVKLMEELGELSEAILANDSYQRTHKLNSKEFDISSEIADVMLVTMLLAKNLDVDVKDALKKKIKKIKKRNY